MTERETSPAFQFYPTDFLADDAVAMMTNEQVGAYILLLCYAWQRPQGLPASESLLAKLCRCTAVRFRKTIWPALSVKFHHNEEGRLFNPRLENVRREQISYRERSARAGRASAAVRAAARSGQQDGNIPPTDGPTGGPTKPQLNPNTLPLTPSPTPSPKERTDTREPNGFARFWLAYPRKVGRDAAMKAFAKRKPDEALVDEMLAAVAMQTNSEQWTREGGRYIPNPATWINQGRWKDALETAFEKANPLAFRQPSDLDLREAGEIYRRNWGGRCHHEEGHKGSTECIQQIAIDRRLKRSA
jgi:uncharacterized protein YdaU (DUF1376 family)